MRRREVSRRPGGNGLQRRTMDYVIITGYDMTLADEHGLEFLLAFDGRIHHLEEGYWIKFELRRIRPTRRLGCPIHSRCTTQTARGWLDSTTLMVLRAAPVSRDGRRRLIIGIGRRTIQADRTCSETLRP